MVPKWISPDSFTCSSSGPSLISMKCFDRKSATVDERKSCTTGDGVRVMVREIFVKQFGQDVREIRSGVHGAFDQLRGRSQRRQPSSLQTDPRDVGHAQIGVTAPCGWLMAAIHARQEAIGDALGESLAHIAGDDAQEPPD